VGPCLIVRGVSSAASRPKVWGLLHAAGAHGRVAVIRLGLMTRIGEEGVLINFTSAFGTPRPWTKMSIAARGLTGVVVLGPV
jgi:hypothetical protein